MYINPCIVCTHGTAPLSKRKEVLLEPKRSYAWWHRKSPMIPFIRSDRKVFNISKLCTVSKLQLTESR
jgi:hypothetical protein